MLRKGDLSGSYQPSCRTRRKSSKAARWASVSRPIRSASSSVGLAASEVAPTVLSGPEADSPSPDSNHHPVRSGGARSLLTKAVPPAAVDHVARSCLFPGPDRSDKFDCRMLIMRSRSGEFWTNSCPAARLSRWTRSHPGMANYKSSIKLDFAKPL
jgi:hypothetical protein